MAKEVELSEQICVPLALKRILCQIDWGRFLQYGSVKVTIREGKLGLITAETTDKAD
jgi:hypothetical protein